MARLHVYQAWSKSVHYTLPSVDTRLDWASPTPWIRIKRKLIFQQPEELSVGSMYFASIAPLVVTFSQVIGGLPLPRTRSPARFMPREMNVLPFFDPANHIVRVIGDPPPPKRKRRASFPSVDLPGYYMVPVAASPTDLAWAGEYLPPRIVPRRHPWASGTITDFPWATLNVLLHDTTPGTPTTTLLTDTTPGTPATTLLTDATPSTATTTLLTDATPGE